ncbi:GOLPH3/VPS74 family protein [Allorhizocola rhizosphaerae]|uniref:GOLPH3/VPS74 family protein n=1 Tax=Allorhizocola rhizosphaerae TaxID=1872709 RepID=UPI0013C2BB26|nr:GPP34 family phosphoprotein [Allorhizocola rhizosphaerae]
MAIYLADEFYLIAHEDTTGQPRLHAKAAGFGVAAALLAELYLQGNVTIDAEGVKVLSAATPPDLLAHTVLDHLMGEAQRHPLRDWLAFLGRTAVEDVANRLTRAGVLQLVQTRRLFAVNRTFVPVAINDAAWPHARVASRLARRQPMDPKDQILAGLAFATGLTREMLWDDAQQASQAHLAQVIAGLPAPMRTLVAETEVAISKSAATRA